MAARRRTPRAKPLPAEVPDVRDGLTRAERIVLSVLKELSDERGRRGVSTLELYGRVVERLDLSQAELQAVLSRLAGRKA